MEETVDKRSDVGLSDRLNYNKTLKINKSGKSFNFQMIFLRKFKKLSQVEIQIDIIGLIFHYYEIQNLAIATMNKIIKDVLVFCFIAINMISYLLNPISESIPKLK